MACGAGACGAVVAAVMNEWTDRAVTVHLRGGDLNIRWDEDGEVWMTGPVIQVYHGEFNMAN